MIEKCKVKLPTKKERKGKEKKSPISFVLSILGAKIGTKYNPDSYQGHCSFSGEWNLKLHELIPSPPNPLVTEKSLKDVGASWMTGNILSSHAATAALNINCLVPTWKHSCMETLRMESYSFQSVFAPRRPLSPHATASVHWRLARNRNNPLCVCLCLA